MAEPAGSPIGDRRVIIGQVSGIHGVTGWVKVFSYTRPKENIFTYSPWQLQPDWTERNVLEGKVQGKGLIVRLEGIDDRDSARNLMGMDIAIFRSQLPDPEPGCYYWYDLIGLDVVTLQGDVLGKIVDIQETGANDVLIIEGRGRHLVPLITDEVIKEIDLEQRRMMVDWIAMVK